MFNLQPHDGLTPCVQHLIDQVTLIDSPSGWYSISPAVFVCPASALAIEPWRVQVTRATLKRPPRYRYTRKGDDGEEGVIEQRPAAPLKLRVLT